MPWISKVNQWHWAIFHLYNSRNYLNFKPWNMNKTFILHIKSKSNLIPYFICHGTVSSFWCSLTNNVFPDALDGVNTHHQAWIPHDEANQFVVSKNEGGTDGHCILLVVPQLWSIWEGIKKQTRNQFVNCKKLSFMTAQFITMGHRGAWTDGEWNFLHTCNNYCEREKRK